MPRDSTLSRTQARAPPNRSAPRTRAGAPTAQAGRPYPTRVDNSLRPLNPGTQRQPLPTLLSQGPEDGRRESGPNDPIHADCRAVFQNADRDRAQLVAQLNEQRREASEAVRHHGVEKVRSQAQIRKLDLDLQKARAEIHKLKQESLNLQKRFDEASPDQGTYVLRLEHEHILNELGRLSSSMTRKIELRKSESENVSMTKDLPPSDALQSPWVPGQFDVLDDPVIPDDVAPMLSTSEALALPNFGTYGEMS